jgi:type IV pilus assembly protein PilQ
LAATTTPSLDHRPDRRGRPHLDHLAVLSLPALGLAGASPASFAISLFSSAANRFLNLELSALEADGKGKIVSSPRVITADQTKALIEQGTEFAYQQATSSGATGGLPQGRARSRSRRRSRPRATSSSIWTSTRTARRRGEGAMSINTKHVKTQVLVENGGTVVIGGIFELTETDQENKVPLLGDVPVLGNLFKQRTAQKQKCWCSSRPR